MKTDLLEQCKEVAAGAGDRSQEFEAMKEELAKVNKELEELLLIQKYLPFAA